MWRKAMFLAAALVAAAVFSTARASERLHVEVGDSPTLGPATAPVTLMEFIDFQ